MIFQPEFVTNMFGSISSFFEQVDQALAALDEWIKKSPHLQKIRCDRQVKCQEYHLPY